MLANVNTVINSRFWWSCLNVLIQSVVNNSTKCIVLVDININLSFPVITYDSKRELAEHFSDLRPELYIVDFDQVSVKEFMKVITKCYNYNPEAIFIVKTTNNSFDSNELSSRFVQRIIRISERLSICSPEESNERIVYNLGYEKIYGNISEKVLLEPNVLRNNTILKICHISRVPYFICTSLNCQEKSGLNFDITTMIMEYLKFNFKFVLNDHIYAWKTSELFLSSTCDLVLIEIGMSIDGGELNFIYNVNDDYDRWVVPRAERVPKWKYLFKVFSLELWIIWFSFLIIVSLVWGIFDCIFSSNKSDCEPSKMKNQIKQPHISGTDSESQYPIFPSVFSLAIILFLIFMMNNLYKGRFTFLLLGMNRYPEEIEKFEDILNKKIYLLTARFRFEQLKDQFPKIENYSFYVSSTGDKSEWLNYVAYRKDSATLKSTMEVDYVSQNYLDENGMSLIRVLDSVVVKITEGAVYLRGNPIFLDINKYVNKLRDHGFVQHIWSKYQKVDHRLTEENAKDPEIMTCHDLAGPIAIWLIGISISIFLSFLEHLKLI
ncbi:hypothetical protein HHI36_006004 [Cryptolaemus montrouzieri]|uniref:Uncharacterized protein n=1 Tax=Cryptolaemus montrouzieri TaxID=559131 RepID=A0ABD2NVZ0_9CUCU